MHVLIAYSQPRGKYGKYVFTVMVHFAEETETVKIEVMRPEKKTQVQKETYTVYSCDHCGRWASIVTHTKIVESFTFTPLQQAAHTKDGRLELFRYDNVVPDDFIELTLRDSEMFKYQMTRVNIGWDGVSMASHFRLQRFDGIREDLRYPEKDREIYKEETGENSFYDGHNASDFLSWLLLRENARNEINQKEHLIEDGAVYDVNLLPWDEYVTTRTQDTGDIRAEEELVRQTMNAEEITIKELLLEPTGQPLAIEGNKRFIEGTLKYP